jgi:hypothetical protein
MSPWQMIGSSRSCENRECRYTNRECIPRHTRVDRTKPILEVPNVFTH